MGLSKKGKCSFDEMSVFALDGAVLLMGVRTG
jgi:hypothetical protein